MRIAIAAVLALVALPAAAQDHHLVQWKKTQQCEIVTQLPLFGSHFVEVGLFSSRFEAEQALRMSRKRGECPAAIKKDAKAEPPRPHVAKPRHRSTG